MTAVGPDHNDTLEPLLLLFRRRWGLIAVCVLLGLTASLALSVSQQGQYVASATVLFRISGIDQELFGFSAFDPNGDQPSVAATNMALVSLPIVASRTAAALDMSASAVRSAINVSGVGQANIAQINATAADPHLAARIANAYAEQFVLFDQETDKAKISRAQGLVEKQIQALPAAEQAGPVGQGLQSRANQLMELAALQTGNAEVVQSAGIPTSPSGPSTKRDAIIGILIGALLGLGLAFLAERFDRRLREPSELDDAYGVAVLGAVPFSRGVGAAGIERRSGAGAGAFANLRARLRYFNADREVRSLLVTSALADEGKTTIAVNLAIAEAAAGNTNTVLIEADLRHPRFEERLGLDPGPGLTEILTRKATLRRAVRRVHLAGTCQTNGSTPGAGTGHANDLTSGFSVITAGDVAPNPVELLESRAMLDLLTALSERFDLVIIDAPSPSLVPDPIPLMRLVTGVVIVARKNVSTRDAARQLSVQLAKLQVSTLGVVANEMSAGLTDHGEPRAAGPRAKAVCRPGVAYPR